MKGRCVNIEAGMRWIGGDQKNLGEQQDEGQAKNTFVGAVGGIKGAGMNVSQSLDRHKANQHPTGDDDKPATKGDMRAMQETMSKFTQGGAESSASRNKGGGKGDRDDHMGHDAGPAPQGAGGSQAKADDKPAMTASEPGSPAARGGNESKDGKGNKT